MGRATATSAGGGSDAEVRWLSAKELAAWIELRRLVLVLPSVLESRTSQQTGLTFFEYQVLATLSESVARTRRMSELAGATSSSLSRLSHAVARLEAKGLVTRRRCDGVGRSSVATMTNKGHRLLVAAAPDHVASIRALVMDGLTRDQLDALATIARRITERLGDACADGGGLT